MNFTRQCRVALGSALLALLAACGSGGGGGGDEGTGTLKLALTDAPSCGYEHIYVTVEKIRLHKSGGAGEGEGGWSEIVVNPARRIDLLDLNNGALAELGQTTLPAGTYNQLRLVLTPNRGQALANAVVLSSAPTVEEELVTPSATNSGLKLNVNFSVGTNQLTDLVLDMEACKSVKVTSTGSGKYILRPVVRVIARSLSGVSGTVDSSIASGSTTVALQRDGVIFRSTIPTPGGSFLLQPVEAGSYTLVVTAPGRETMVVRRVVVGDATVTPISTTLRPATSTVGTLSGTVTAALSPIDADVGVLQSLTGGPAIELISRPVDGSTGAFRYSLPTAAPVVTSYVGGTATLTFTPDTAVAGQYSLQAQSSTAVKTAVPTPTPLTSGGTSTATFALP